MKKLLFIILLASISNFTFSQGYYADIFMDGGVGLSSKKKLYAADSLGLTFEFLATEDSTLQANLIVGNDIDQNGILLYPDGSPRFRMIYTNGGKATKHGKSLTNDGRNRIRQFYFNGGSYTGSCAGAFMSSLSPVTTRPWDEYYQLFPGRVKLTSVYSKRTGHTIPENSPLLNYYQFGNDNKIDSIYHWGGCYLRENYIEGAEILLKFNYPGFDMHEQISAWSYKTNDTTGRIVAIGSHPEYESTGEGLDLMKAMVLYGLSDQQVITHKGSLSPNETRKMMKESTDNDPMNTKIGDGQYHHFTIKLTEKSKSLNIIVVSAEKYPLDIYMNPENNAGPDAPFKGVIDGDRTTLKLSKLTPGEYNIAVYCPHKVTSKLEPWGHKYISNLDLLNGVGYTIEVK